MTQLQPGTYQVTVEKPGFRTHTAEMLLQVNTPATMDAKLEVGAVSETVNVTAEVAVVNTENATVGNPFTETQVKEIPLQTRNVVALLSVEPGVAPGGQVLGSRPDQNNVLLDGVDVNDNQGANGFNAVLPIPLDSVQEFRTTVAGLGADMGRSAGGQVAIVTKGGSNRFHGSLYEYNRNTLTSANSWFSNRAGVPRSALVRNQYGASLGGPVLKNRLFFFFNYEGRKDRSAASKTATVPTSTFAQGIVQVLLKDGRTVSLSPQDVTNIDPLHIGASSYMLSLMKQYPAGNNPLGASDKGLNFNQLLFNAPQTLDNHAMVGRMDYNIDSAGRHTLMLRGTLNGAGQDSTLAQFPGQAAASRTLDNSRGLAARYTAVLTPHLVNALTYGYTRLGTASTGNENVIPSFGFTTLQATARASQRVAPTTNVADDLTWTKGRHTVQVGVNMRFWENDRLSFNNVPNYSFNRNTLLGLGADIDADVLAYLQPIYGSGIALSSSTNVTNAFGALLGLVNQFGATYNYNASGQAIPFGQPVTIAFAGKEFESYVQDTFKMKRNLTLTYGLRYSIFGVPYEMNGTEVVPQTSLSQFFADRVGGQAIGIPSFALPTAMVSYQLGGPLHNAPGYYPTDLKDFAPRASIAYSPDNGTLAGEDCREGKRVSRRRGYRLRPLRQRHGSQFRVQRFAGPGQHGRPARQYQFHLRIPLHRQFATHAGRAIGRRVPVYSAGHSGRIHHLQRRVERPEGALRLRAERQLCAAHRPRHEHRNWIRRAPGAPRHPAAGFRPAADSVQGSEVGPDLGASQHRPGQPLQYRPHSSAGEGQSQPGSRAAVLRQYLPRREGAVHHRQRQRQLCSTTSTATTPAASWTA